MLTWWQDPLLTPGNRSAGIVIDDSSYHRVAVVRAGNGYQPDLHEFQITPQGTALITVYDGIECDLHAVGGPAPRRGRRHADAGTRPCRRGSSATSGTASTTCR